MAERSGGLTRSFWLAWAPVLAFLLAIVALKADEPAATFEHPYLLLLLNFVFSLAASVLVVYLLARSFALRGTADRLLFGCGLSAWALAGLVAVATGLLAPHGAFDNRVITVHNLCTWLAGAAQLAGAVLLARRGPPLRRTGLWLPVGHMVAVTLVGLVVIATVAGWTPPFFVPGRGGTALRHAVVGSASAMFAAAAALILWSRARSAGPSGGRAASSFESWYAAALALIAVGLVGVDLQTVVGGPLGWVGRAAQFLSGAYFVVAAMAAVRQSHIWGAPLVLAARDAEERYRALFETMSEGFALHEILTDDSGRPCDYRFLRVNPAFERLTGLVAADLVGRRVLEVLPGTEPSWIERYGHVALTGEPARFESYAAALGRWYEVSTYRPAPGQFAVVFADVSDRKEAEKALRDALARADAGDRMLRALMDHVPEGITIADASGKLVMVSRRGEELLGGRHGGLSIEEVARQWCVFQPDGTTPMPPADLPLARALRGEVVHDFELVQASARGEKMPLLCNAAPILDRDGSVAGGVVAWRDITERRRADEALRALNADLELRVAERTAELAASAGKVRAERQRFLDVLETLPVMVTLIRPDHHVPFANRAYRDALGEALGRPCYAYQFGRDEPCEECQAFVPLQTGRPHRWEWTLPTGRTFDINDFPFTDSDGSPMILEMDIDITESRRAERELRSAHAELAARAEQLRRLTGELTLAEQRERRRVARVLHDHLQQLLVGARFRTSALGRGGGEGRVTRSAGEIEALLEEALAVSRTLTAELSPPILHEGGLGAGLGWLARWMGDRHGLTVDLSVEEPAQPLVDDVKVLLFESVRELLFNAVKHAAARTVNLDVSAADGMLGVTVADSGPGFDPAALGRLGESGGLGLFSIRERLGLIGGRVEIDSKPGQGSRIRLVVPLGAAFAPAPARVEGVVPDPSPGLVPTAGPAPGARARIRVLLADDHAVVREGVARLLGGEPDIEVVGQAAEGHEALRLARELLPDVVLMDVSMPGLDGVEATRAIHAELPRVRVVGLSMFEEADQAQAMREAGASDYVTKSGPATRLVAAIRGRRAAGAGAGTTARR
jgi:PAS domain S-box-containing protein